MRDKLDNVVAEFDELQIVARRCNLPLRGVKAVVELLDEGATIPFIARYRKERTGKLDEVALAEIENVLADVRELTKRKQFVKESIEAQGALTDELTDRISRAETKTELEDLYAPYKPKRRTKAAVAKANGLEPLAKIIMSGKAADPESIARRYLSDKVKDTREAIDGASDIIAEWASESIRLRNMARKIYRYHAQLKTSVVKDKREEIASSPYSSYSEFSVKAGRIASHQFLAIARAEREGFIRVKFDLSDSPEKLSDKCVEAFVPRYCTDEGYKIIRRSVEDAVKRLISPSIENEMLSAMKEEADKVAIDIFSDNLRQLLLAPPLKGRNILAIDPGFRTGCKIVTLDSTGGLTSESVIYPTPPRNDIMGAAHKLRDVVSKYDIGAIALGNGTASRETDAFLRKEKIISPDCIYMVNENGASVYSASEIARKEFPDKDVTVRGAVSIGRRLIDPLAELVKIDPKSIGVGQYQHDVDQSQLKKSLDRTVINCVNAVGIDLNTASAALLSYVSGIGSVLAANIVKYREQNGEFRSRAELLKVARLGEKAYQLSAGFLRVAESTNPLDNTGIHPESYHIVEAICRRYGVPVAGLTGNRELLDKISPRELASAGIGGEETIKDIIEELRKPGRDPRVDNDSLQFSSEVESFEQLRVGMILQGRVNNITAFGAFVDLGIKENGLLHISCISNRRIKSVTEVLKLGDVIDVKIKDIDASRRRISLCNPELG